MGHRTYMERGPYPVDAKGFPVPVWETAVPCLEDEYESLHHYNYTARLFGSLAIANTFRNLSTQQIMLPDRSHRILHEMYGGIKLPPVANMLDYIEEAKYRGTKLNIRWPGKGYLKSDITDTNLDELYEEYNKLHNML